MTDLTAQELIDAILRSLKRTGERFARGETAGEANPSSGLSRESAAAPSKQASDRKPTP